MLNNSQKTSQNITVCMPKSNDGTSLEAYLKHNALHVHANYNILVPWHILFTHCSNLLTFNVFLTRASNDRCPWEWTGKISLSVPEMLSVYLIMSVSTVRPASLWHLHLIQIPTLTLRKSFLHQDSTPCLLPVALAEETLMLSRNQLMSCKLAENTPSKDQT